MVQGEGCEHARPHADVDAIERCSGHEGSYAVKEECHEMSRKISRPVVSKVQKSDADRFTCDCPMAMEHIAADLQKQNAAHPLALLHWAYGI